jgi:transglutaminase-like putative cysteine protease
MAMRLVKRLRSELARSTADRWWDTSAAALLLLALAIAAQRLVVTEWTDHLNIVRTMALLGGLAGLVLGLSRFSSLRVFALGLAYGLFAVSWQLGLTLTYLSDDARWAERFLDMVSRVNAAFVEFVHQQPVQDPLLFVFLMTCLFWTLGIYAGYTMTRHAQPWRTIFPAGLTLLIIHTYDPVLARRIWFLAAYLFFSLLLVARLIYLHYHAGWQQDRVFLHSYVGTDLSRITLQITIVLVLVAWIAPTVASALSPAQDIWDQVTKPWIAIRDRLDNAVAALRNQVSGVYNMYGADLALGRGTDLSDDVFLVVAPQPDPPLYFRYYWRARVYDHYDDGQWSTTIVSDTRRIAPGRANLPFSETEEHWTSVFTVTTAVPMTTLYAPADLVWTSYAAQADLADNLDDTVDVVALHATPPLGAGTTYRVHSSLSTATIAQLREVGTDYPLWVTSRYLQLPSGIPPRVYELARQIASELDNPYDIAAAITSYLRTYIRYSETISARRPSGQEAIDWFLFDLREGYCTYYATAEVIMLRSLGIPVRLAVGFSQGERESGRDVYIVDKNGRRFRAWSEDSRILVVRRSDSHAWPEVYFPEFGWIEFEPTASQPPLRRPLGEDRSELDIDPSLLSDSEGDPSERWRKFLEEGVPPEGSGSLSGSSLGAGSGPKVAIWALIIGLSLSLTAFVWRKRRLAGLPPLPVLLERGLRHFDLPSPAILSRWVLRTTLPLIARAYLEINYGLKRLGAPPAPADTPAERTASLSHVLPEATNPAHRLLTEYHATAYSPRHGNPLMAREASRRVRALSWRTAIRRLIGRG